MKPVNAPENVTSKLKLFLSYSRRNLAAADELVLALEGAGFEVTIDRRDLPYGEEWQKELADFIRASDTVVWLVSPDSVKSKWCNWELGEVVRLSKRLVPVRIVEIAPGELPEALGKIHVLPIDGVYRPDRHQTALVAALQADRGWVKEATLLADRAREWIARERNAGLLLRGPALKSAETWSTRRPKAAPPPASEILELILASRQGAVRRQRWAIGGALSVAAVSLGLAAIAFGQWQRAEAELTTATAQRLAAEAQAALAQSEQAGLPGAPDAQRGVLLALESLGVEANVQADRVLKDGLHRLPGPSAEIEVQNEDELAALGPGSSWIAIRRGEAILIFDTGTLAFRTPSKSETTFLSSAGATSEEPAATNEGVVARSADGRLVVVESEKGLGDWVFASLALKRAADNRELAILKLDWQVRSAFFRRDGRHFLTVTGRASMDASDASATRLVGSTVHVWEVPSGLKVTEIPFAHWGGITHLAFDRDGEWLAVQVTGARTEGATLTRTIVVMPIWPDLARVEACRRLNRNLSLSEWATALPGSKHSKTCPGLPLVSE